MGSPHPSRALALAEQLAQRRPDAFLSPLAREGPGVGTSDHHEVVIGGQLAGDGAKRLPQEPLDSVSLDRPTDSSTHRNPEARLIRAAINRSRERVDHEVAIGVRAAATVDAVEVRAPREPAAPSSPAAAALAGSPAARALVSRAHDYGVRRRRPFARRRLSSRCPARVRERARKPWVRARLRFLGW